MLKVIRAGADVEKARWKLGRLGRRVKRPMICQRIDAQRLDRTLFISGNLRLDVIVAPKACATDVLAAIFNPFDRFACRNRLDNSSHVSWIDGDLVAKATTDIRRDNSDKVFPEAGHNGEEGTMRMRSLPREPHRPLARSFTEFIHAPSAPIR